MGIYGDATMAKALASGFRELREILSGNVGIMAFSWFLFGLSSALVFPFFKIYAKELDADDFSIALVQSIGMYVLAFLTVFGGFMTDYLGRVKTIVLGTSLIVFTQFGYAFVQNWPQLAILWIIDEAAHFYQPALTAIIMDSLPRDKTLRGFLILQAFPNIPWLFMPIIGGVLYDMYGLTGMRIGFLIAGTISAIVLILRIKGLRETMTVSRGREFNVIDSISELFKYRKAVINALKIYVFTGFLSPLTFAVAQTYGGIYVVEVLGATKTDWGLLTTLSTAVSIVLAAVLAVSRNVKEELVLVVGGTSLALSQILMAIPGYMGRYDPVLLALAVMAGAISNALLWPLISTMLTHILPLEIRGRATGFQRMFENLGLATSSLIAGFLYTKLGPANSLLFSGFIGFAAMAYLTYVYHGIFGKKESFTREYLQTLI